MAHLAILGASGHGKVIADTASLDVMWQSISFFDDTWPNIALDMPWPILGDTEALLSNLDKFSGVIVGIGNNIVRGQKHRLLSSHFAPIVSILHPGAYISSNASIGLGSVVLAQAAINTHVRIGLSSIINTGATIDHDSRLDDYVHISPGANLGGNVKVGRFGWVGIGSSVKQGVTIGENVIVGAGAAVVSSLDGHQTVVGVPARPLSINY